MWNTKLDHSPTGKTTAIRRTAVRETGGSRHHVELIEGPPETHQASLYYMVFGRDQKGS